MEQESLKKATDLILDAIQNSEINLVDKLELLINLNTFLTHYHEAIKQRFTNDKKEETVMKRDSYEKNKKR